MFGLRRDLHRKRAALLDRNSRASKQPSFTIPVGTTYEVVTPHSLEGWYEESTSKAFGDKWIREVRSCILIVSSLVAKEDNNILLESREVLPPRPSPTNRT